MIPEKSVKELQPHKVSALSGIDDYKGKNKSHSWNQNFKANKLSILNDEEFKEVKKQWKASNSVNSSTLSLHIAAYENSGVDNVAVNYDGTEGLNAEIPGLIKKLKNFQQIYSSFFFLKKRFEKIGSR